MKLIFVRHGEVSRNPDGTYTPWSYSSINENGIEQAREAAALLSRYIADGKDVVFQSSPMKRALQTAEILRGDLDVPIEIDENLRETIDKYCFPRFALFNTPGHVVSKFLMDTPFETGEQSFARADAYITKMEKQAAQNGGKDVTVVASSHRHIMNYLRYAALNNEFCDEKFKTIS